MRIRIAIFLLLAIAPSGIAGNRPLKMVIAPFLSFAPVLIAEEEGFFEEQGLDVELVTLNLTAEAIPVLVQGRIDVLAGNFSPSILNAIARGGRIRIVADKGWHDPEGCAYAALVASRKLLESGRLDHPDGLRGLRCTTERSSPSYYMFERVLRESGVGIDEVRLVDIPQAAKLSAFENGAIDLASASEPWLTILTDAGRAAVWKPSKEIHPGLQMGLILFGPTLLDDDPATGVRFMTAYLKGIRAYLEGKTERNVEILARWTGLEPDLVRKACWISVRADGRIDTESILRYQEWCMEQGLQDRMISEQEFWDPRFLGPPSAAPVEASTPEGNR